MKKIKLTAAIYDRWLSTLGGGEQVVFAYAEILRDFGYETTLLTHKRVNLKKAEQKMNVDLKKIKIRYLPEKQTKELSQHSEEYDVFINTSYLDYFPNLSSLGILSVFFPDQIFLNPFEYIKRSLIIPSFRKFFIYPSYFEGFAYDDYIHGKIFKWLGENSRVVFTKPIKKFSITIYFEIFSFSLLDKLEFYSGDKLITPVQRKLNYKSNTVDFTFEPQSKANKTIFSVKLPKNTEVKLALIRLSISSFRFFLYNVFKKIFPTWEMRLHGGPGITNRSVFQSYDKIITISKFCQTWIEKYWKLPSEIIYPPVNIAHFKPAVKKKNWIIHVGRFFVTGHNKKQLDMVKIFKRLVDEKKLRNWQLHLVGSVHEGEKHQSYFMQTKAEARGYPVYFHRDAPFKELRSLLSKAKIYWHATGLDQDEKKDPILFEHFGVTTVEAMSSGCVPVVINAGGQKEIVSNENGFLWNNREEWVNQTIRLITDSKLLKRKSKKAIQRSKYFSREKFKQRFKKLLSTNKK